MIWCDYHDTHHDPGEPIHPQCVLAPVNWMEVQPYTCYFYPMRDCPGHYKGQVCETTCQRVFKPIPTRTLTGESNSIPENEVNVPSASPIPTTDAGQPGMTLLIEFPRHPDWETRRTNVTLGKPFYLVGSEGRYTLFLQTVPGEEYP